MIYFRQLFDTTSSTCTYLLGDSRDEFIAIMSGLNLPMPRLIDRAVPANQHCGQEETNAA